MFQSGFGVIEEPAAVQAGIEDRGGVKNRLLQEMVTILWIRDFGPYYFVRVMGDEMRGIH